MSGLWTLIVVIGAIFSLIDRIKKKAQQKQQQQQQEYQSTQEMWAEVDEEEEPEEALPNQQSAYDWIFGNQQPDSTQPTQPTSTTSRSEQPSRHVEGRDDEDWIHPVETTVRSEYQAVQESAHEIVHESVHESLHVRRSKRGHEAAAPAPTQGKQQPLLHLNKQTLAQALLLQEALEAPRSKRPWSPTRR